MNISPFISKEKCYEVLNIALLYIGKTAGFVVIFLFLPAYRSILGSEQFGAVAVIYSLQTILILLDLGLSILVCQDIASGKQKALQILKLVHVAEICLLLFYLFLTVIVCLITLFFDFEIVNLSIIVTAVLLLFFLVLQNLYYASLIAQKKIFYATVNQFFGLVIRSIITLIAIKKISPTLQCFILAQLSCVFLQALVTRFYINRKLKPELHGFSSVLNSDWLRDCLQLIKRGSPLLFAGIAGAAASQLDKPIISLFISLADVSPYFLAMTYSSIPVSVLASPIVQYYQPLLTKNVSLNDRKSYKTNLKSFVFYVILICLIPFAFLFVFSENIITFWLGASSENHIISQYAKILLSANAIASIGYIPYVIILAKKQYKFQAVTSIIATVGLLTAILISALFSNIELICYSYAGYYLFVTLVYLSKLLFFKGKVQFAYEN